MLIPVVLNFRLSNITLAINVNTDKMYDRVSVMLQDVQNGRRHGPLIMSGDDMVGVYKAFDSFVAPNIEHAVQIIQHSACVREATYFSEYFTNEAIAA